MNRPLLPVFAAVVFALSGCAVSSEPEPRQPDDPTTTTTTPPPREELVTGVTAAPIAPDPKANASHDDLKPKDMYMHNPRGSWD